MPQTEAVAVIPSIEREEPALSPETARLLERLRLGYKPLWQRLESLRNRARSGARSATWLGNISAAVVLFFLVLAMAGFGWLSGVSTSSFWAAVAPSNSPLGWILLINLLLVPVALLVMLIRLLAMLLTLHRVFGYYYAQATCLFQQGEARFYVEEEFHKLLAEAREVGLGWQALLIPAEKQRSIERELEYLACYAIPLHYAAWLQPIRGRFEYVHAQQSYRVQPVFNVAPGIWGLVLLIGAVPFSMVISTLVFALVQRSPNMQLPFFLPALIPVSMLLFTLAMIPLSLAQQQAPRYIISRAYLVALLDFMLGRHDNIQTPARPVIRPRPPGTFWQRMQAWLARQTAPWSWRGRAPE